MKGGDPVCVHTVLVSELSGAFVHCPFSLAPFLQIPFYGILVRCHVTLPIHLLSSHRQHLQTPVLTLFPCSGVFF